MTHIEWLASVEAELERRDLPSRESLDYTDSQWLGMYRADPEQSETVDGICDELCRWSSLNRVAPIHW